VAGHGRICIHCHDLDRSHAINEVTKRNGRRRPWCERRQLNQGYVLRKKGKPDPTPARAEKRMAARYYQLMSGHALTGVYLKSTDNRPDDHCWWCDPDNISSTPQTRDHLFKHCSRWKDQQAQLWARVTEEARRGKRKWRVRDLLADERCSPAVLDFLRTTYIGRSAPPVEENRGRGGSGGGGGGRRNLGGSDP